MGASPRSLSLLHSSFTCVLVSLCLTLHHSALCHEAGPERQAMWATQVLRAGGSGSVFGFGPAGSTVAVRLINARGGHFVASASAKVSATGEWRVRLGKLKVGAAATLLMLLQPT